jgi:alkylation response protein AidB-like acyl-CoA dehydrogenase
MNMIRATSSVLVEQARALRPIIEAEAAAAESNTTTTARVIEELTKSGLYWIQVPRELGGDECGINEAIDVYAELAYADGSTGWSAMANISTSCLASIYTGDEAAKAMFAPDAMGIHAGMLGPVGKSQADADGYVVSGNYQFGSGCPHATWIGAGTIEQDRDGKPVTDESGIPVMRTLFLPAEQVTVRGNWDVMGLSGTGSYDYQVKEQFVPAGYSFPLLSAEPQRGGPQYNIGLFGIVASGHVGFALGVGRRALDEVLELAVTKQRTGQFSPIVNEQLFQHDYAMQDAAMRAARSYVAEAFGEAEAAAVSGAIPGAVQQQRMRQATTYATRVAADAARFAYLWAGSNGLRNGSVVQRCFRDIHAGTQHIYVDNNTLTAYTTALAAERQTTAA